MIFGANFKKIRLPRQTRVLICLLGLIALSLTLLDPTMTAYAEAGDCRWCNGGKKCQDCWPAGRGVTTGGVLCYGCNGSGKCNFCRGSGVCYSCDGRGMDTGCSDCGKYKGR
jgi:hypothetical protein